MNAQGNWNVVESVISSTYTGAQVMGALPSLVRRLLDEGAWREFSTPDHGTVRYERFTEFVEAAPTRGLGGRIDHLVALCGKDEELARRVRQLAGRDIEPAAAHGEIGNGRGRDSTTVSTRPDRDTAAATVARLKRDDPDLAERVVAGEISAYAADRQLGKRPPRIELRSPRTVAERLRQHFTDEQLTELRHLLDEETP